MKRKNIPLTFRNKVIAFTGTYPGVGKSYIKNILVSQLKDNHYKVFDSGTTHKATNTSTVASISYRYNKETKQFIQNGPHPRTDGFYIIDEAFMMSEITLQELKAQYPRMCFILFGDPMQFLPASGEQPLSSIDLLIELDKIMRAKDEDLINAITSLKEGIIPVDFMLERCIDMSHKNDALVITYCKTPASEYNKLFNDRINNIYVSHRYAFRDAEGTVMVSNSGLKNGDLWRLIDIDYKYKKYTLQLISKDDVIKTFNNDDFHIFFENKQAVNNHKIQGDTIKKGTNIFISLNDNEIWKHRQTLLRHLYVAISRAEYSSQIYFRKEEVENLINELKLTTPQLASKCADPASNEPMFDFLKDKERVVTNSCDLAALNDIFREFISVQMKKFSAIYIVETISSFGQGSKKQSDNYQELPSPNLTVLSDRGETSIKHLKNTIEDQLSSRPLIEIPGKGNCFVTVNKTTDGQNHKGCVEEFNWFVFEIDEIDGHKATPEEIYKLFIDRRCKYKDAKKYTYRIVYSGNKSYHFWVYIDNDELNKFASRELYKDIHNWLNDKLFNGWADRSISTPEHLVRAPGVIRPDTDKEQELVLRTRKICHIENIESFRAADRHTPEAIADRSCAVVAATSDSLVMQAFNMYKDDIPTINGGRGSMIIAKLFKESRRGVLDKDGLVLL
ncbi:MAG: AAA family ATPase, partial [Lachnospiraceae bacterium]|nr:AAA family ATPase [Lachnospiraceae bacterium]